MKTPVVRARAGFTFLVLLASGIAIVSQTAPAATDLWNVATPGLNNWNIGANWTPAGPPGASDTAVFGAVGTSGDSSTINNVVSANATVSGLSYTNTTSGTWHVTQIPAPNRLVVSANFVVGGITADSIVTSVGMVGDGTFEADAPAFKVGDAGSSSTSTLEATLDMSSLSNFVYSSAGGTWIVAGSGGDARGGGVLNLAAASNNITVGTINFNTGSGNNSGFHSLIQLGTGTNIFNVGNFIVCQTKAQFATVQFLPGAPSTAGLRLRGTNGNADDTSRANITLGDRNNSGGATTQGQMLLNGYPVDMKAGTVTIGQDRSSSSTSSHSGVGELDFDTGIVDVSNIVMAICTSAGASASATGTLSVGANGKLLVGNGGISLVRRTGGTSATGNLNILGAVVSSNSIIKSTAAGTATVNINAGSLKMINGSLGTPDAPIDILNLTTATLTLSVSNNFTNVVVSSFNPVDTANVINISSLPVLTGYPSFFPIVGYASLAGGGSVSLGTLPGTFTGYVSNDMANTVWLVVTNGPATAKNDQWSGASSTAWNTTSLNWTNLDTGLPAAYAENDAVIFNDFALTTNVTLSVSHAPLAITFTNDSLNYNLSGSGSIVCGNGLLVGGTGSVTLRESGGDAFAGNINVNGGGTLILDDANNTNSCGLIISPGSTVQVGNNDANVNPPSGGISDGGTLIFAKTDSATIANPITGSGLLNQNGSGTLVLSANNSAYSGNVTASSGTLALTNAGSLSNSPNVVVNSATLDLSGVSSGITTLQNLSLNNSVLTLGTSNQPAPLTVSSLTMSGTSSTINLTALPPIASYPSAVTIVQSQSGISGYNAVLGTIPAGFTGTLSNNIAINAIQLVVTSGPIGQRTAVLWTGADASASTPNTNWSDNANWQLPGQPVAGDHVFFNNTGAQSSSALSSVGGGFGALNPANIDNIVDNNFILSSLAYTNTGGLYHNTYINGGHTLSVTNSGLSAGAVDTGSLGATTEFVTVSGINAALSVNNTNANVQVYLGNSGSSGAQATLDLSALDNFNMVGSRLLVGATIGNVVNRPSGIFYLAKTNNITAGFQTTNQDAGTTTANGAIVVSDCNQNPGSPSSLFLGLSNNISADTIGIGRQKGPNTSTIQATLQFNPIYVNVAPYPAVTFEGFSASSVSAFEVANSAGNTGSATLSALVDLTGGIVNANVSTLNVSRSSSGGSGHQVTGTFNFDAGTIDANTVNVGLQPGANPSVGAFGVSSNTIIGRAATLNVSGSITLALGASDATTTGNLNITNGTVIANSIIAGTNGTSTINLIGGRLTVPTTIANSSAPLSTLNLTPLNTPDNSNTVITLSASNTAPAVVNTLTIDGQPGTTNILNISSVVSGVTPPAELPVIQYSSLNNNGGTFNLGLGTLPAGYSGYLTNDTTINTIAIVITSIASATPTTNATITHVSLSGTNLLVHGTNNNVPNTNFHYLVLTATNLATRLSNWTIVVTNPFNPDGTFDYTNPIVPGTPRQFIDVKVVP